MNDPAKPVYSHKGFCPICETSTGFVSYDLSNRDNLVCLGCPEPSVPRERALMLVMREVAPDWRNLRIHESSPANRGVSALLKRQAASYSPTHFVDDVALGDIFGEFRCENLEKQTFADAAFDLVISLDVMEHVNRPDLAFQEIYRTLIAGGHYIFTAPTLCNFEKTMRISEYQLDGSVKFFGEPDYHFNPISNKGSPVTFYYGYDLPELICQWTGFDVRVHRFCDQHHGIIGAMTEVYVCRKPAA